MPGEQTDLGKLDIVVGADRRGIVDAHKRGGQAAAESFVRGARRGAEGFASAGLSSVGLAGGVGGGAGGVGAAGAAAAGGAAGIVGGRFAGFARAAAPFLAVGAAAAVVVVGFRKLARSAGDLVRRADDEIARLARVSPGLSAVQVRSEVFQLLRDLRRARFVERDLILLRRAIETTKNNLQDLGNAAALVKVKIAGFGAAVAAGATENLIAKLIVGLVAPQAVVKQILEDIRDAVTGARRDAQIKVEEDAIRDLNLVFLRDLDAISGREQRGLPTMFPDPALGAPPPAPAP